MFKNPNIKLNIKQELGKIVFCFDFINKEDFDLFKEKIEKEMIMYRENSLYNILRFKKGIVHQGYFEIVNNSNNTNFDYHNTLNITFTSTPNYFEDIKNQFHKTF